MAIQFKQKVKYQFKEHMKNGWHTSFAHRVKWNSINGNNTILCLGTLKKVYFKKYKNYPQKLLTTQICRSVGDKN